MSCVLFDVYAMLVNYLVKQQCMRSGVREFKYLTGELQLNLPISLAICSALWVNVDLYSWSERPFKHGKMLICVVFYVLKIDIMK